KRIPNRSPQKSRSRHDQQRSHAIRNGCCKKSYEGLKRSNFINKITKTPSLPKDLEQFQVGQGKKTRTISINTNASTSIKWVKVTYQPIYDIIYLNNKTDKG